MCGFGGIGGFGGGGFGENLWALGGKASVLGGVWRVWGVKICRVSGCWGESVGIWGAGLGRTGGLGVNPGFWRESGFGGNPWGFGGNLWGFGGVGFGENL